MSPKVSACVVTYNQQDFIAECLESILSQDYQNFEICISDDCSTDSTPDIIDKYINSNPGKIKFIRNSHNLGITINSNVSLSLANGEYVTFTAGDDLMLPGKLAAQVEYMEQHPECRISYHNSEVFDSKTRKVLSYSKDLSYSGKGDFNALLSRGSFIGGCEAMVRRSFIPDYGYDERLPIGSDWKLHLDILIGGGEVHYLDRVLAGHRRHSNNITSSRNPDVQLRAYQDLVTTCGLVVSKRPSSTSQGLTRLSSIYREMLNINGGSNYLTYLQASLLTKFSLRSLLLFILGVFGFRR